MASSAVKRRKTQRRATDTSEWLAATAIMAAIAIGGYWAYTSGVFEMSSPSRIDLGTEKPANVLSAKSCRPSCRASFQRCEVSTGGFKFMQSSCQETLKQCLIGCEGSSRLQ